MSASLRVDESWLITDCEGRRYLGHIVAARRVDGWQAEPKVTDLQPGDIVAMMPIYELAIGEQDAGQGRVALGVSCQPYGLFGHSKPVKLALGATAFVGDLDPGDQEMVRDWVRSAESTKTQLRAARIGLATVKPK